MGLKVQTFSEENKHVRVTIIIAYLDKEDNQQHYNYTHVDDCYPDLFNTRHLINKLNSNDTYQILGIEYEYEIVPFDSYEATLVNIVH